MPPEQQVKYDDWKDEFGRPPVEKKASFDMTGLLIKWGLVSDRQQAQYALIALIVSIVIISAIIVIKSQ